MSEHTYALLSPSNEIIEYRQFDHPLPLGSYESDGSRGKNFALPVTDVKPEFDPETEILEGPEVTITSTAVTRTWTLRPISVGETEDIVNQKIEILENEYRRRSNLPFQAEVDGTLRTWHGDPAGIEDLSDVLFGIAFNMVPDPRPWKPYEEAPVMVSHNGFKKIKLAHAFRKDALFVQLQILKGTLRAMTDIADVRSFDPVAAWGT